VERCGGREGDHREALGSGPAVTSQARCSTRRWVNWPIASTKNEVEQEPERRDRPPRRSRVSFTIASWVWPGCTATQPSGLPAPQSVVLLARAAALPGICGRRTGVHGHRRAALVVGDDHCSCPCAGAGMAVRDERRRCGDPRADSEIPVVANDRAVLVREALGALRHRTPVTTGDVHGGHRPLRVGLRPTQSPCGEKLRRSCARSSGAVTARRCSRKVDRCLRPRDCCARHIEIAWMHRRTNG
jgi:hypothetical protein